LGRSAEREVVGVKKRVFCAIPPSPPQFDLNQPLAFLCTLASVIL
jgi:hypothetical protein